MPAPREFGRPAAFGALLNRVESAPLSAAMGRSPRCLTQQKTKVPSWPSSPELRVELGLASLRLQRPTALWSLSATALLPTSSGSRPWTSLDQILGPSSRGGSTASFTRRYDRRLRRCWSKCLPALAEPVPGVDQLLRVRSGSRHVGSFGRPRAGQSRRARSGAVNQPRSGSHGHAG